ncbi:hypothetical protein NESM_000875600 [Novymonas esmeraldas]|uniref:Transmembrane protein n=1 Tax=Novymonas esmeraldas TaxID=1808958 RepID=A0AAW0F1V7_9TRYP
MLSSEDALPHTSHTPPVITNSDLAAIFLGVFGGFAIIGIVLIIVSRRCVNRWLSLRTTSPPTAASVDSRSRRGSARDENRPAAPRSWDGAFMAQQTLAYHAVEGLLVSAETSETSATGSEVPATAVNPLAPPLTATEPRQYCGVIIEVQQQADADAAVADVYGSAVYYMSASAATRGGTHHSDDDDGPAKPLSHAEESKHVERHE